MKIFYQCECDPEAHICEPIKVAERFFNTTLGISMLPDGVVTFDTLSDDEARDWLAKEFENVANPNHANSLDAISRKLGVDVRNAKGGRVRLDEGDSCLVAEITGIPRETREFTDAEIAAAKFIFRIVRVMSDSSMSDSLKKAIRKTHKI